MNIRAKRTIVLLVVGAAACGVEAKPAAQLVGKRERTDTGGAVAAPDTAPSFQIDSTPPDRYAEFVGSGAYIDTVFKRQIGEAPRLGWFLNNTTFLTGEKYPRVYIMTSVPSLIEGTLRRIGSDSERRRIRDTARVACDGDGGVAFFDVPRTPPADERRAFFFSKPIQPMQSGAQRRTPTPEESQVARSLLRLPNVAISFLESVLTVSGSEARFVLSAAYDAKTTQLIATSLALLSPNGRLVGSRVSDITDVCDGCPPPTLENGLRYLYPILNGYTINGFAYPLLLLNTSTNEGQARSLVTFNRAGTYGEYRSYEYVVNCGR